MNWYTEASKRDFNHDREVDELWSAITNLESKRSNVSFNRENDEPKTRRLMKLDFKEDFPSSEKYFWVLGESRIAGGDWEAPNVYFRAQIHTDHNSNRNLYSDMKFVFFPEQSPNLVKQEDGTYTAKDGNDDYKNVDRVPYGLWVALKNEAEKRLQAEKDWHQSTEEYRMPTYGEVGLCRKLTDCVGE